MGTGGCSLDMVFNSGKQNSNSNVNESIIFFNDWTVSYVICDHSILSSGQMTDSRSRCQHGKEFSVYLQYHKCCKYFVIQLSSEPDKQ